MGELHLGQPAGLPIAGTNHQPAAAQRLPAGERAMAATLSAAAIASAVTLVPAASPTARKNASTVAISLLVCTRGASAAPITA